MRISILHILSFLLILCILTRSTVSLFATTATTTGSWNSTTTWGGSAVPGASDIIIINSGVTVTMTSDYTTSANLSFVSGGTIQMAGYNLTVGSLTATGSAVINNTGSTKNLTVGSDGSSTSYTGVLTNNIQFYKVGSGTLTLSTGTSSLVYMEVDAGTLKITSGSYTTSANVGFQVQGGILTMTGGTITGAGGSFFAVSSGSATISGGSISAYFLVVGWNHDVTVTISGGSNTFTEVRHQDGGTGTLTLNSGGSVSATVIQNHSDGGGIDGLIVNLNSGSTITTGSFGMYSTVGSGSHTTTLNLNGGTITANAGGNLFDAVSGSGGTGKSFTIVAKAGGATINTNGFDCYLLQSIIHDAGLGGTADGGIIKTGTNHLRISQSNTYTGGTTISNGDIVMSNATGFGTGTVNVSTGAIAWLWAPSALTIANDFILNGSSGNTSYPSICHDGGGGLVTLNGTITLNGNSEIGLGGTSGNDMIVNGVISGAGSLTIDEENSISGLDDQTTTLNGANTYTGGTIITGGTLKLGNASALAGRALSLSGSGILDLNGYNNSITNITSSVNTATISDYSGVAGTTTLNITAMATTIACLVKDGGTRKVAVRVSNANFTGELFTSTNANTFSAGLTLANNASGTRMRIMNTITTVGTPGAITSSPFGTGSIYIGESATDRAGILFDTHTNNTLVNALVFNTALGTDFVGIRTDVTGITLSGAITANLADATFSTNGTATVTITGQITGSFGLNLDNTKGTSLTITLNNAGTANSYSGTTNIDATICKLVLGAANQIPNGSGKGDMVVNGTFNLGGFSETINGLTGSGIIDGISGSPTLTIGDNNITSTYSGVIQNIAGTLAITKIGSGTLTISGVNTFDGTTTISGGTLQLGNNAALPNGPIAVLSTAILDLNGFNNSVSDITTSSSTATIKDNSLVAGTTTLNITAFSHTIVCLVKNGATRIVALRVANSNSNTEMFLASNLNTFSGGLTLANSVSGTRLKIFNTITGTPFGTGSIIIGESATDKACIFLNTNANTITNNIIFNTILGTDRPGIRVDIAGIVFSGTITANLSDALFSTDGTGTVSLTGQITGNNGLSLDNGNGISITVTLNNAGTANSYTGKTTIDATKCTLVLGAADQIPNGSGKGDMVVNGTFNLGGFSETINGISGSGIVDGISGTPTLTVCDNNTTSTFDGVFQDAAGALAITKTGTGSLYVTGTNTYSGLTTISNGILCAENANALGSITGATTVSSGAALVLYDFTYPAEALTINSTGCNPGTYPGALRTSTGISNTTVIYNGTITLGSNSTIGVLTSTVTLALSGIISGAFALTKEGPGILNVSGANTYTGSTTVSAGTLQLGASSNLTTSGPLGTNAGGVSITSGATLDMNGFSIGATNAEAITINGTGISGSGAIMNSSITTATYAGLVTLGSASSIQGETGLLAISNAGTITGNGFGLTLGGTQGGSLSSILGTGAGTLTKEDAGIWTLSGYSTFTGATTVNGGTLKTTAGNADPGAIGKSSSLTINSGATVLAAANSNSLFYTNNVPVTINGGTLKTDDNIACNIYGLITLTGGTLTSGTPHVSYGSWILNADISVTGNVASTISASNITVLKTGGMTITVADGTAASDLNVTGTFWTGSPWTETGITKAGAGTMTLSGTNTFDAGLSLSAGTININNASALGTGTFTIANGTTINNTSGGAISLSTDNAMTWNGDFTFTGSNDLNLGIGTVTMGSSLRTVTTTAGTLTVGGTITGTGGLTKSGTGTMTLGGIAAYNWTGPTTINGGIFNLGTQNSSDWYRSTSWTVNSGATLFQSSANILINTAVITVNSGGTWDMNSKGDAIAYVAGAGNITNMGGITLDIGTTGSGSNFSGVISGGGSITVRGNNNSAAGTQILSGLNTYTGSTTIQNGILSINTIKDVSGGSSSLGSPTTTANGTISMGDTTKTGTLIYTGTAQTSNRVIKLAGTTGGATIDQSGTGALVFSSALTATGLGVKTLTLQGSTAGTGEISGAIIDGSGTTAITKTGTGSWTLSGANTYTGLTTISTGILKLGSSTALGSAAAGTVISDSTALDLNGITYANAESITLNGTGVSSSGAIYNSNATAASFPGAISLASASTVTANHQITLTGTISNNQHFTKAGTSSLIFTNNTVTVNNLALSAGTLVAGTSTINVYGSFTNSGTFTANTGTVNFLGSSSQAIPSVSFYNFNINNSAGATMAGDVSVTGTLTLTAGDIDVGTSTLTASTISGGSASSYIVTNTAYNANPAGYLKIPSVNGAIRTFPVGTAASYTPCFITNSGTAQDFKVRAFTGVYTNGLSGTANPDMAKLVNRTWEITPVIQSGINAIITLQWNAADEGATFAANHSHAVISKNRHIAGNNNWVPQSSNALTGSNPYSISTVNGISTFSTVGVGIVGSSLPIELKTFKVHKTGKKALINWTTASETINDYFTLEHAIDGQNWQEIFQCDGAGTSTIENKYSFIDNHPISGINYYRLKQTDLDGKLTYSAVESVEFNNDSIAILVYPMPAIAEEMNIILSSFKIGTVLISISDITGRLICKGEIEVTTSPMIIRIADICAVTPGTYLVTITNNDMVVSKKIVIQ